MNCLGCMRVGSSNSSSGSCDAATSASDAGEGYNACALNEQKILSRSWRLTLVPVYGAGGVTTFFLSPYYTQIRRTATFPLPPIHS